MQPCEAGVACLSHFLPSLVIGDLLTFFYKPCCYYESETDFKLQHSQS
ncbi:mCG66817 [Mus musculus]|nr:mCG66817 [Mus musculus]